MSFHDDVPRIIVAVSKNQNIATIQLGSGFLISGRLFAQSHHPSLSFLDLVLGRGNSLTGTWRKSVGLGSFVNFIFHRTSTHTEQVVNKTACYRIGI